MTKVLLDTLGCKLNQAETESLTWDLACAGYEIARNLEEADVYVLNTCSVTATADAKSRHLLRQACRANPGALVVATGCYAEREPGRLSEISGVSVVSNHEKGQLVSILEKRGCLPCTLPNASPISPRTRSFIKVQDGCNGACAYCVVPGVRKGEKSVAVADVLSEVKHRVANGFKEIVLTGTEIGAYRSSGSQLKDLLETILARTDIPRVRLSSLQPQEVSPELISLWQNNRLCPHFHLSLQSGCNDTLQRMRRRYSVDDYAESVSLIRSLVPDAAITTDIMVGFPGESSAEFEECYGRCCELEFSRIHVFPFSSRPGTMAATLPGKTEQTVMRERCRRMLALADRSAKAFRDRFKGTLRPVLWEHQDNRGVWTGLTDNYIPVQRSTPEDIFNLILPAAI